MVTVQIVKRMAGHLSNMPFAHDYICLKNEKYGSTHWIHVNNIRGIEERCIIKDDFKKPFWWYWFFKIPETALGTVTVIRDEVREYLIINSDIIQFLTEMQLARGIDLTKEIA